MPRPTLTSMPSWRRSTTPTCSGSGRPASPRRWPGSTPAARSVTGGETARAIVAGLDEPTVEVLDEPLPGIVRGRLNSGVLLITKAGGFGDAETFVDLYRLLTTGSA